VQPRLVHEYSDLIIGVITPGNISFSHLLCVCSRGTNTNCIIYGDKSWGLGERLANPPEIPFHADSNKLLFISIALKLMEILVDCDPI
jgi:hypothetical protein